MGTKLREARERQGVSLSEVAASTKVSVTFLKALERDDVSRVPGGVFARGYVRSYATAVKLDPEATVAEFVAQSPVPSVQNGYPAATVESDLPDLRPSAKGSGRGRFRAAAWLSLAAAGAVVVAVVFHVVSSRPSSDPAPSALGGSLASTQAPSVPIRPANDAASVPALPIERPATPVAATPATIDDDPVGAPPPGAAAVAPTETPAPALPAAEPLALDLSVTKPSWVIVTADGRKVISRMFDVGDHETLEARREVVVTANAAALVMSLNGAPTRPLSDADEIVTTRITGASIQDYLVAGGR